MVTGSSFEEDSCVNLRDHRSLFGFLLCRSKRKVDVIVNSVSVCVTG